MLESCSQNQTTPSHFHKIQEEHKIKQKLFQLGKAYFPEDRLRQKQYLRLFNGKIIASIQNQKLVLSRNCTQFQKDKWNQIFLLMRQYDIEEFNLGASRNPNILKSIQHIKFPNLKELNLFSAKIQNFEALSFLDMPSLNKLNLIYNNCPNFKSLARMNLPSLQNMCIYIMSSQQLNRFNRSSFCPSGYEVAGLQRWNFNLTELRLEKYNTRDSIMINDLNKLAKSKQKLQNIYLTLDQRIVSLKSIKSFHQKQKMVFNVHQHTSNQYISIQVLIQMHTTNW